MNIASGAPRRCSGRFGTVPGDAVFSGTIIFVAINRNANLTLISDAAFLSLLLPHTVSGCKPATFPTPPAPAAQPYGFGIVQQAAFQVSESDFGFPL